MFENLDFRLATSSEISHVLAMRLKALRIQKGWLQADVAARIGVSRSTFHALESTGKGGLETWIKWTQCLGQAGQLQALFKPTVLSIADMQALQEPQRQRASRQRAPRPNAP
jgi:DNA-binding XRE family transcriptional regulator